MTNELNPGDAITGPPDEPAKLDEPGVLRDIIEALRLGVLLVDAGRCVLYQNTASRRLLGAEPWETLRNSAAGASGGANGASDLEQVRQGASLCEYELCLRESRSVAPRWILVDAVPLRVGADLGACLLTFREVTEPRADRMMCEKLSRVVEQTADVVVITDEQGVIEYVNPAFEAVTGYPRTEVTGMTPGFLRSGHHDHAFYRQLWDTILAKRPYQGTIVNRRKSGELFVSEQTITPVMDESEEITHFVSVAKDVTEARQAESRAREMALARAVQQRLYPRSFPDLPGYDLSGQAFPMGSVGGDYFDFIPSAGGGMCLVIGDVSGHGPDGTYSRVACGLTEGDTVAMFTDGVTEASSPSGHFFEHARALRVVQSHRHEPAGSIVQQLHRACMEFVGHGQVSDDLAVVVCKLVGRAGRAPRQVEIPSCGPPDLKSRSIP